MPLLKGLEEIVQSLLPGRETLEEEMDLSQETERKLMGSGRQEGEDRVKQEKNPSVQKSGASCSVGTFKQPNTAFLSSLHSPTCIPNLYCSRVKNECSLPKLVPLVIVKIRSDY